MLISQHNLTHLNVYTQSDKLLGKIHSFDIDVESQSIMKYHVRGGSLLQEILRTDLLIHRSQVISISKERMVVEDTVLKEAERADKKKSPLPADQAPAGIVNKEVS